MRRSEDGRLRQKPASNNYRGDIVDIADIESRVCLQQHHIGPFSEGDGCAGEVCDLLNRSGSVQQRWRYQDGIDQAGEDAGNTRERHYDNHITGLLARHWN